MHQPSYILLYITTFPPPPCNQAENSPPVIQPAGVKLVLLSAPVTVLVGAEGEMDT